MRKRKRTNFGKLLLDLCDFINTSQLGLCGLSISKCAKAVQIDRRTARKALEVLTKIGELCPIIEKSREGSTRLFSRARYEQPRVLNRISLLILPHKALMLDLMRSCQNRVVFGSDNILKMTRRTNPELVIFNPIKSSNDLLLFIRCMERRIPFFIHVPSWNKGARTRGLEKILCSEECLGILEVHDNKKGFLQHIVSELEEEAAKKQYPVYACF